MEALTTQCPQVTALNKDEFQASFKCTPLPQLPLTSAACKLTDGEAVIELEAAEYLVDISCMIKAIASYHNLKGFCKQKHRRFMIYL